MNATADQRCRILVADDDDEVLEAFRRAFSPDPDAAEHRLLEELEQGLFGNLSPARQDPMSFDIVTCTQGQQALEAVLEALQRQCPFKIIFLDIRMPPGIDGVRTAQRIRDLDRNVTIVFITAYSDESFDTVAGLVPPPTKLLFFTKPFLAVEFVGLASKLCGHSQFP